MRGQEAPHRRAAASAANFCRVQRAIGAHMRLVVPCRDACRRHRGRHRRPMVRAVQQKGLDQRRVAGDVARAQPRAVRALGQAAERDKAREAVASERRAAASAPSGGCGLVAIDLGIAFVGGDHEAVAVRQIEQRPPLVLRRDAAGGIVRRADVDELRARPNRVADTRPSRRETVRRKAVDALRRGSREQRRAFVDLIERIRNDRPSRRRGCASIDRLRKREQRFAAAEHRQNLRHRHRARAGVTPPEPRGDRLAQRGWLRRLWDNSTGPTLPAPSASRMNCGVGWRGSPIDRLIGGIAAAPA